MEISEYMLIKFQILQKSTILDLYNAACMYVLGGEHLVLDKLL